MKRSSESRSVLLDEDAIAVMTARIKEAYASQVVYKEKQRG